MQLPKFLRILSYVTISIVVLFLLLLTIIIFLLRSPVGSLWLTKTLDTFLSSEGITFQAETVQLSFPNNLTIKNLSLEDKSGTWLNLDYASASINPWTIFKGIITITSFDITNLNLTRLPVLVTDEPPLPQEFTPLSIPQTTLPWWLRHLKLHNANLTGIYIHTITEVPLQLSLSGNTSSTGWQAQISVCSPAFSSIQGSITLTTDHSLLKELQAPWQLEAQLASTRNKPFLLNVLDQPLDVNILIYSKQDNLVLDMLSAQSKPWDILIKNLAFTPKDIHGELNIIHTNQETSHLPMDLDSLSIAIKLSGNIKAPTCDIDVSLEKDKQQSIQATTSSKLKLKTTKTQISTTGTIILQDVDIPDTPITNTIQVDASLTPTTFSIKNATCKSPLIDINFSSELSTTGALTANLIATSPNIKDIVALTSLHTPLSGQCSINIEVNRSDQKTPLTGASKIQIKNIDWSIPSLQGLLGQEVELTNNISFTQETPQNIQLNDIVLTSKNIQGKGSFALEQNQILIDVNLGITDLASTNIPLNGDINLTLKTKGTLLIPSITLTASSPKITFYSLTFDNPTFRIETTSITSSNSQGIIDLSTDKKSPYTLKLSTDWMSSPTELSLQKLSGNILGLVLNGNISMQRNQKTFQGSIAGNISTWKELGQVLKTPFSGKIAIETSFNPQNNQAISTELNIQNFSIRDTLFLKSLKTNLSIKNLNVLPEITLNTNIESGMYDTLHWDKGTVKISGTTEQLTLNASTLGDTTTRLELELYTKKQTIHLKDFQIKSTSKNQSIILSKPTNIAFSQEHFLIENLDLRLKPSGSIITNILISPQKLDIQTKLDDISLSILDPILTMPLDGTINSSITISGTPLHPKGTLKLHSPDLQVLNTNASPLNLTVTGTLKDTPYPVLELNTTILHDQKDFPATITANIPIDFTETNIPTVSKKNPLSANIQWKGRLETLWQFAPIADTNLTGQGSLSATLNGTITEPSYKLHATTTHATYTDLAQGIYLEDITSNFDINSKSLSNISITIDKNKTTQAKITGTIGPESAEFPITIHGAFTNFCPLQRKNLILTVSGNSTLSGTIHNLLLHGDITINQGELILISTPGGDIPILNIIESNQDQPTSQQNVSYLPMLNLTIHIPSHFFVRGTNLESEWSGTIILKESISNPQITGKITSLRGVVTFIGKDFLFTNSSIIFTSSIPPIPTLDVSLTYKSTALTAIAHITGPATKPEVKLSSTPPLPQDEIVAQVLFGKNTQNLNKIQLLQLASELTQLTGFSSGENNILDQARKITGMDVLRIGSVTKHNTTNDQAEEIPVLEIGKRLTDSIYLGLEQGLDSNTSGAHIEIELNPNLMLEGRTGLQNNEIGINWKKDYQ